MSQAGIVEKLSLISIARGDAPENGLCLLRETSIFQSRDLNVAMRCCKIQIILRTVC
jgi:hypothetical protein